MPEENISNDMRVFEEKRLAVFGNPDLRNRLLNYLNTREQNPDEVEKTLLNEPNSYPLFLHEGEFFRNTYSYGCASCYLKHGTTMDDLKTESELKFSIDSDARSLLFRLESFDTVHKALVMSVFVLQFQLYSENFANSMSKIRSMLTKCAKYFRRVEQVIVILDHDLAFNFNISFDKQPLKHIGEILDFLEHSKKNFITFRRFIQYCLYAESLSLPKRIICEIIAPLNEPACYDTFLDSAAHGKNSKIKWVLSSEYSMTEEMLSSIAYKKCHFFFYQQQPQQAGIHPAGAQDDAVPTACFDFGSNPYIRNVAITSDKNVILKFPALSGKDFLGIVAKSLRKLILKCPNMETFDLHWLSDGIGSNLEVLELETVQITGAVGRIQLPKLKVLSLNAESKEANIFFQWDTKPLSSLTLTRWNGTLRMPMPESLTWGNVVLKHIKNIKNIEFFVGNLKNLIINEESQYLTVSSFLLYHKAHEVKFNDPPFLDRMPSLTVNGVETNNALRKIFRFKSVHATSLTLNNMYIKFDDTAKHLTSLRIHGGCVNFLACSPLIEKLELVDTKVVGLSVFIVPALKTLIMKNVAIERNFWLQLPTWETVKDSFVFIPFDDSPTQFPVFVIRGGERIPGDVWGAYGNDQPDVESFCNFLAKFESVAMHMPLKMYHFLTTHPIRLNATSLAITLMIPNSFSGLFYGTLRLPCLFNVKTLYLNPGKLKIVIHRDLPELSHLVITKNVSFGTDADLSFTVHGDCKLKVVRFTGEFTKQEVSDRIRSKWYKNTRGASPEWVYFDDYKKAFRLMEEEPWTPPSNSSWCSSCYE